MNTFSEDYCNSIERFKSYKKVLETFIDPQLFNWCKLLCRNCWELRDFCEDNQKVIAVIAVQAVERNNPLCAGFGKRNMLLQILFTSKRNTEEAFDQENK